jgi:hypothetical protein
MLAVLNTESDQTHQQTTYLLCVMPSFQQNILLLVPGGRFITLPSAGSEANANPGNPSVTRLIHKM